MVRVNSSTRTNVAQVAQAFPLKLGGDSTAGGETVSVWNYRTLLPRPDNESSIFAGFARQLGTGSAHRRARHGQTSPLPLAGGSCSLLKEERLINKNCFNWENWGSHLCNSNRF